MSSYDPDPTGLSDGEQGNQIPCIDPEETRMWEEIIRSPEAEAYWRGVIAGEYTEVSDSYYHNIGLGWPVKTDNPIGRTTGNIFDDKGAGYETTTPTNCLSLGPEAGYTTPGQEAHIDAGPSINTTKTEP